MKEKLIYMFSAALAVLILLSAVPAAMAKDFSDVGDSHWAAEYAYRVSERGLMIGTSATRFSPEATVTRGMTAAVIYRLMGEEACSNGCVPGQGIGFIDVPDSSWYGKAVTWAVTHGVLVGYPDGTFNGEAPVTRAEMAVVLCRLAEHFGYGEEMTAEEAEEKIEDELPVWAEADITALYNRGIVNCKPGRIFDPDGLLTRAEFATLICRFSDAFIPEEPRYIMFEACVADVGCTSDPEVINGGLNGDVAGYDHLPVFKCESMEELKAFKEKYSEHFSDSSTYKAVSFDSVMSEYTEEFFEDKSLILVYAETGYPGCYGMAGIMREGKKITVSVRISKPGGYLPCICDGLLFSLEVKKSDIKYCTEFDAVREQ